MCCAYLSPRGCSLQRELSTVPAFLSGENKLQVPAHVVGDPETTEGKRNYTQMHTTWSGTSPVAYRTSTSPELENFTPPHHCAAPSLGKEVMAIYRSPRSFLPQAWKLLPKTTAADPSVPWLIYIHSLSPRLGLQ